MIKMPGKEEASIFMERLKLDSREVGNQFYFSCMCLQSGSYFCYYYTHDRV